MKKEKENIKILREKFLVEFCKQKGWNSEELTTGQMFMIVKQLEYINPKI
jgi:hypothetical protein